MKTILIIEDNINILENLGEFLELEGYKTLVANNGKKGVELATEFIPDLIICDICMTEMDGNEVFLLLLNSAKTHEIPFILSTALSEQRDREQALKSGADDYIVKPYQPETLLKIVADWLKSGSKRKTGNLNNKQI